MRENFCRSWGNASTNRRYDCAAGCCTHPEPQLKRAFDSLASLCAVKVLLAFAAVSSPGHEFIQISLTGPDPEEVTLIVNAFTKAFETKVVDVERLALEDLLDKQRAVKARKEEELRRERHSLQQMEKTIAANPTKPTLSTRRSARAHPVRTIAGTARNHDPRRETETGTASQGRTGSSGENRRSRSSKMQGEVAATPVPEPKPELPPIEVPAPTDEIVESHLLAEVATIGGSLPP